MNKTVGVIAAVGVVTLVLVLFGIFFAAGDNDEVPPPEVTHSDYSETLVQASDHLLSTDYVVEIESVLVTNESEEIDYIIGAHEVQNSDEKHYYDVEIEGAQREQYGNCAGAWIRAEDDPLRDDSWEQRADWDAGPNVFGELELKGVDFEVNQTDSHLVYNVTDPETVEGFYPEYRTHHGTPELTIYVSSDDGRIDSVELDVDNPDDHDVHWNLNVEYTDVQIDRPEDLTFGTWERLSQWIDCRF